MPVPNKRWFLQLSLEILHVIDAYTMSSIYMKYFKLVYLIKRRYDHKGALTGNGKKIEDKSGVISQFLSSIHLYVFIQSHNEDSC